MDGDIEEMRLEGSSKTSEESVCAFQQYIPSKSNSIYNCYTERERERERERE